MCLQLALNAVLDYLSVYHVGWIDLPIYRVQAKYEQGKQVSHLRLVLYDEVDLTFLQLNGDAFPRVKGWPKFVDAQVADHVLSTEPKSGRDATIYDAFDLIENYANAQFCPLVFILVKNFIDWFQKVYLQSSLVLCQF